MANVSLVAVLDDGGLGKLTIVGALILMSGLKRLAKFCRMLAHCVRFVLWYSFMLRILC